MARALLGYVGNGNEQVLATEIARLRRRVAELEQEIAQLKDGRRADLDLELHRLADSTAPALA